MPLSGRASVAQLVADFGKIPPDLRKELRPALRKAALPIQQDMRRRAAWSDRIPGAIRLGTSLTSRNPGLRLVVDASKAPHARPWEMGSRGNRGRLRHRVFGRDVWVSHPTRPFFFPAVDAGRADVADAVSDAVSAVVREHGFR